MKRIGRIAGILLCGSLACQGQLSVPGKFETNAVLPAAGSVLRITAKCGRVGGKAVVSLGAGAAQISLTGADCPEQNKDYAMSKIPQGINLKDGALAVVVKDGPRFSYYIRPNVRFYGGKDFEAALQEWDKQPAASEHEFTLTLRPTTDGLEWWLDGRYLAAVPVPADSRGIAITLAGGAQLLELGVQADPRAANGLLLPVEIRGYRGLGGATTLGPLEITNAAALKRRGLEGLNPSVKIDVGLSRWLGQAADSGGFYDRDYMRGAFDGIPESLVLRVPKQVYTTAWLLCAVDPSASPWMTVRIGRYRETWDGSGISVGDAHVKVDPQDAVGVSSLQVVGRTTLQKADRKIEVPLCLVAVPLATDKVADYLQWTGLANGRGDFGAALDWFNVEFSRKIETRLAINSGIFDAKPVGPASGVQILGVTLQCEPVHVLVKSTEAGFSFYQDRKPRLLLETHNATPRQQTVVMTARVADFDGITHDRTVTYQAAPGVSTNGWRIDDLPLGWYDAQVTFRGAGDAGAWSQQASLTFALLPPDTRQAGPESPYGTWWFQGSHYTEPDPARVLPLFKKMGFRHSSPGIKGEPGIFARYQVTPSMMGYKSKVTPTNTLPLTSFMTNWPTVKTAMIFHETGIKGLSTALPHELTGAPPEPFTDEQRAQLDALRTKIEEQAAFIRGLDPDMKIMVGNGSTTFNSLWFREKLPTNLWDYCGLEMGIQTLHPESQPTGWNLQSYWIARQMADIYGYTNFPVTSCYEVGYRPTAPGGLSLKRQADWYARDVLHMLAWRSPHINVALIIDVNASYYTSRWGSTGVFNRSPLHLPKPAFVSLATLTLMLDQARYLRAVPTGSTGVYCLEFKKEREYVYAIWCSRGARPVELTLDGSLRQSVDSMARDLDLDVRRGKVWVKAGESPVYVSTRNPVDAIALGAPVHPGPALGEAQVVESMRDAGTWRIVAQGDETFETYCDYWPMVKGDIAITNEPQEAGQGGSLSLTLRPQPEVKDIVARYVVLEPVRQALPITGQPDTLGVWVKGNSGWGRIYFEFADAQGRHWISNRGEGRAWDLSDWEGETSINHDGWRFVGLPLPQNYPSGHYKPSARHWACREQEDVKGAPAYPIALSRLYVLMREKLVYVTGMTAPATPTIELRDITAGKRRTVPQP